MQRAFTVQHHFNGVGLQEQSTNIRATKNQKWDEDWKKIDGIIIHKVSRNILKWVELYHQQFGEHFKHVVIM